MTSLTYLLYRKYILRLQIAALSADIYSENAKPVPDVVQVMQWRNQRFHLSEQADVIAARVVIERAKTGVYLSR